MFFLSIYVLFSSTNVQKKKKINLNQDTFTWEAKLNYIKQVVLLSVELIKM